MLATRSEIENAPSRSCVAKIAVVPLARWSVRISARISTRSLAPRFDSGSSNIGRGGLTTSARASATRCRGPPDSRAGSRSASASDNLSRGM
jgi:hypothetical protein